MPIDIVSPDVSMVDSLYNFELEHGNAVDVNGVVLSTLGASNSPVDPIKISVYSVKFLGYFEV